jgi:hypothetical protein
MITLITRACSRSREVTAHCHVCELHTSCGCPAANHEAGASRRVTHPSWISGELRLEVNRNYVAMSEDNEICEGVESRTSCA